MAEALLRRRLAELGVEANVRSSGRLSDGREASPGSAAAMAARGLDLADHRSRITTRDLLTAADLVVTMERAHVRDAAATAPEVWPRTFTLKELVRRGSSIGPRRPGQPLGDWLAAVHEGRTTAGLLGQSDEDDVADPIGGTPDDYERAAVEIESLVDALVDLVFTPAARTADPEGAQR
jgi:protein-tyrosine phosphatase